MKLSMSAAKAMMLALAMTSGLATADDSLPKDVQKVVSVTPVPGSCQVEPATMVYIDSQGKTQTLHYQVMGTCQGGV